MSDDMKQKTDNTAPDFDRIYSVLQGYVEFCIRKPKAEQKENKDAEKADAEKSTEQKAFMKDFEKNQRNFQRAYDVMVEEISNRGIPYLQTYVDALKKLYLDKLDWKKDIKNVLVQSKSLNLFKDARNSIIDLYPVLVTVNKTFPVSDYYELSLSPRAAMYGSEINKTQTGSTRRAPLTNEEYQAMIDMLLQVKDYKRFGEWLMAIIVFSPDQMVDNFREEYVLERKKLKDWAYKQIDRRDAYKRAVVDTLLKNHMLDVYVEAFLSKPELEKKQEELEEEIKNLHESNEKEKAEHEERRKKQYEIIQQKEAEIDGLRKKVRDFERCSQQLTDYMNKYQTQLSINERITNENDRRLQEMEKDNDHMQEELTKIESQLVELKAEHEALQADFSLKNNELSQLKTAAAKKEATVRTDIMKELVSGINEQFFYLTMFYLELKETGKLEPESIELYADTLNNIDGVLSHMGIQKIGVIDQTVPYDASIHVSTDAKLSNGEKVVVSGYGWKIGDEIYIKAPVEKGE